MPQSGTSQRDAQLAHMYAELVALVKSPLYAYRTENAYLPVIGEGDPRAGIMFVGEAPGKKEALSGRPFCGAAGRILNELLASIELKREDVYITNIVKDRPPENRDPSPEEIELYAPFLDRQIDIIEPRVIATLGRFSSEYVLERYGLGHHISPISTMHGNIFVAKRPWGKVSIVPLYHPAVALYRNSMKSTLMEDFAVIKSLSE